MKKLNKMSKVGIQFFATPNRVQEIELRLSAIAKEIDADGADLNALEAEVKTLKEERKGILDVVEKRKKLLEDIASGEGGNVIATFGAEKRKSDFSIGTLEYRNAYLRQLQGHDLSTEERTAITAASAVIPTMTVNKIIEKLEQTSALYNRITVTNFPNKLSFPVEGTKNDASWIAMGAASTDSADTFDSVSLGAYKLIKTIEIEADVQAMSVDAFESFIVDALAKKIAKAVENSILNGTGTNQPTGLLKSGEITQTGTYKKTGITYADLCKMIATLPTMYHNNACIVIPRKLFFEEIIGMVTTAGEPICVADPQSPAKFNVLGYPVIVDDYMAVDNILFGDLSYYYFNWAKQVDITPDTSVGFRSATTVYRAYALADGKKALADAFVLYTRAAA